MPYILGMLEVTKPPVDAISADPRAALLPIMAVVNWLLAGLLIAFFFKLVTARLYRLPTRAKLVHDISVPSLPAPSPTAARAPGS